MIFWDHYYRKWSISSNFIICFKFPSPILILIFFSFRLSFLNLDFKTPLWFRAILKLGCVARPSYNSSISNSSGERIFKLDELDFVNTNNHPYLQVPIIFFIFYHDFYFCLCFSFIFNSLYKFRKINHFI